MQPLITRTMRHLLTTVGLGLVLLVLAPGLAQAQVGTVQGRVTQTNTGDPIPGANVVLEGTQIGTATDPNGSYRFNAPAGSYTLVVSAIGFKRTTQPITIRAGETVTANITVEEDVLRLDDLVVTGYSTQERRNLSTSITSVSGDDIRSLPVMTTDAALQGRAAGVTVLRSSGTPGGGVSVRVRGSTSISGSNQPLYVVDGVPVTSDSYSGLNAGNQGLNALATIDPADIASIEVLKDAAATAIYGTRAANGVVVITTRRGQAGATTIEVESSLGSNTFQQDVEFLTGNEYVQLIREGYRNDNRAIPGSTGGITLGDTLNNPSTNFWDAITQTGLVQNYRVSISGGTPDTRYRVTGGFSDEEGALIRSGFQRLSGAVSVDHRWNDRGTVEARASYNRGISERIGNDNYIYGVLTNALLGRVSLPIYLDDAQTVYNPFAGPFSNPIAEAQTFFEGIDTKFLGTVGLAYEFVPGLTARLQGGLDRFDLKEDRYAPSFTSQGAPAGAANSRGFFYQNAIVEATANYRTLINGDHNLSVLGGISFEKNQQTTVSSTGTTFPVDQLRYIVSAATTTGNSTSTESGLQSQFGSVDYAYRNRYLATFTIRRDGSSRFGSDNRFAVFPAFSLGWNAHEEPFLSAASINLLKVRGSYGLTGQQEIGNFASRGLFGSTGSYNALPAIQPTQLANPDLKWETTAQANLGLDFGFFGGVVGGTIEVYQKDTRDLLLNTPVPSSSGYTTQFRNVGKIRNRGIEGSLTTLNLNRGGFRWETTLNLSHNQNEIIKLNDADGDGEGDPIDSGFGSRVAEGQPLGAFYGYVTEGIFRSNDEVCKDATGASCSGAAFQSSLTRAGDLRFKDLDGDGVITSADQTFIGDPNPDLFGGITNNFSFKGLELGVFFQFSLGNDVYNSVRQFRERPGHPYGNAKDLLGRWTTNNPDADIPRATRFDYNQNTRDSDYYVEDGSYIRLKSLNLAYTIPARFTQPVSVRQARLFFIGTNLWTSTKYSGLDPEVSTFDRSNTAFGTDFFTYPQATTYTFGVRLTL